MTVLAPSSNRTLAPESPNISLSESTRADLLKIVAELSAIGHSLDLNDWLAHGLQRLLPHEIFVSAFGNFADDQVRIDIASRSPGQSLARPPHCRLKDIVRHLHSRWVLGDRRPLLLRAASIVWPSACHKCAIYESVRSTRWVAVHGLTDVRANKEAIYVAFGNVSFVGAQTTEQVFVLLDTLIPLVDIAFRKAAVQEYAATAPVTPRADCPMNLSAREHEILELIYRGKTNYAIAATLAISPFTVKNHVQRIFHKMSVSNRTEAAAKYTGAGSEPGRIRQC